MKLISIYAEEMMMEIRSITNYGKLAEAFVFYDKNNDSCIDKSEIDNFDQLDLNKDGCVLAPELMAAANQQSGRKIFSKKELRVFQDSIVNIPSVGKNNIIHYVIAMESVFLGNRDLQKLYGRVSAIFHRVKQEDFSSKTPPEKMMRLNQILKKDFHVRMSHCSFAQEEMVKHNITMEILRGQFNCFSSAFLYYVLAQELSWPLSLERVWSHVFVVWDSPEEKFAFERIRGVMTFPDYYIEHFRIPEVSLKAGVYLKPLDLNGIIGTIYTYRAWVKSGICLAKEWALPSCDWTVRRDLRIALALNHLDLEAYDLLAETYIAGIGPEEIEYLPQGVRLRKKIKELDPLYFNRHKYFQEPD